MERELTGLSGLLLVLSECYLVLSACSEDEGEWNGMAATWVKGMVSMRVTAKRAKG